MSDLPERLQQHFLDWLFLSYDVRRQRSQLELLFSWLDEDNKYWLYHKDRTEDGPLTQQYINELDKADPDDVLYRYCVHRDRLNEASHKLQLALRRLKDVGWRWVEKNKEPASPKSHECVWRKIPYTNLIWSASHEADCKVLYNEKTRCPVCGGRIVVKDK